MNRCNSSESGGGDECEENNTDESSSPTSHPTSLWRNKDVEVAKATTAIVTIDGAEQVECVVCACTCGGLKEKDLEWEKKKLSFFLLNVVRADRERHIMVRN